MEARTFLLGGLASWLALLWVSLFPKTTEEGVCVDFISVGNCVSCSKKERAKRKEKQQLHHNPSLVMQVNLL